MKLDELKQSISTLEQVLDKTTDDINIDVSASETAQSIILGQYRRASICGLVISLLFIVFWIWNLVDLPAYIIGYVAVYPFAAALWYGFLYRKLKQINIPELSPVNVLSRTNVIRKLTLIGEIYLAIGGVVFFALFIHYLISADKFSFWYIIAIVAIFLWSYRGLRHYIDLFRDLSTVKE